MTGEFGLCGYFREFDRDLDADERLQFSRAELPPAFVAADQPVLPSDEWSEERRQKANRNYAMEYVRNGLIELAAVIGDEDAMSLGGRAAYLIGQQYFEQTRKLVGAEDGSLDQSIDYLRRMFNGMGDRTMTDPDSGALIQKGLRIVRDLEAAERKLLLATWTKLWTGTLSAHRRIKMAEMTVGENQLTWQVRERMPA